MKKTYILFLSLFCFLILSNNTFAQNVDVSTGGPATSYATLGAAFTAINSGTHTGVITISIVGNTTELASAVLDSSGNGTGSSYTSISIQPSGGATRTISGAIVGHLVALNGADNVTINGLNTGGNALEFRNSGIGASSTIRFIADATNNTVTNCTITGSTTSFGVVFFSTGSANGNDNNTISNNNITVEGINFPTAGIYSLGTSSVIDNSANIISGNNISDFFSASAVSNGMNLTTGTSGWTISNNKFFQTASRTYTTANTHNAITASVGTGYTVTGNTIGYATSGGTGTYTMLGTIATRFIGINLATSAGVTSSVQGNTVTAISLNTSSGATTTNGIICGINITGTGSVNIGNVTPNTIGATTGINSIVGTATTTGGLVVGINSSTTGTVLIQNNTFGAMSSSGITATIAGSVCGVNVSGIAASMTITGNTIGNGTTDNMRGGTSGLTTGSSLVSGINLPSQPTISTITNNTIQNLTSYGTGTTGFARGIFTSTGTTAYYSIAGNTIFNVYSNSTLATLSNGAISAGGIVFAGGFSSVISGNTIYNIGNTNTGTGGYVVSGIIIANGFRTKINDNIIYGISNASTSTTVAAPGVAAGITVRSGNTSDTIINNMITLGAGQTTNTAFVGIYLNHGSTPDPVNNIFYNTISISGTVTSGAQPSFGLARTDFTATARTATVNAKNNVFDNSRTGGTGKHYAIANNYGATASVTGWSAGNSDNNVLNSFDPLTVGYWTTDQTFAGWKSASSSDNASISAIAITYTNAATGNLRFNMGVTPTQLESGATPIASVTTDIDGFARPKPGAVNGGGTAPDFGAGESDMVPLDLTGPSISYTLLLNGPSGTSRVLTNFATITDLNGVNVTPGTRPRVYYKKSTDANAFVGNTSGDNGWKWVESSNASSPFDFTIDYTIINGGSVAVADVIQYFVVAQDLAPGATVSSNPSLGFVGTSVASISSAPTTPNSYNIAATLPGLVYLGAGAGSPNYPSFSGAAGLFNAINTSVVASDVTVIVQNNTVEDGAVSLNQFASGFRIVVVPGAASTFTFEGTTAAASDPLLELNGADDFLIDGRFGGSGNYLRFVNNHVTPASTGPIIRFVNDSRRSGIGYCTLESNASSSANPMIQFAGTTGFYGNDSLLVDSCLFRASTGTNPGSYFMAIGSTGTSVGIQKNSSIAIINNNFTGWLATSTAVVDFSGAAMGDSLVVDSNRVYNNITMTASFGAIKLTGNGNNCTANFNSIGGSNPDRSGSPILALTGITMIGIDIKSGNTIQSDVHGNTIANFCNMAPRTITSGITKGINIQGGRLNIGTLVGNTIGGLANPWDTVTSAYDNGWIDVTTASVSDTILIRNNTISYANYWRKRNDRNCAINIAGSSGSYIDVQNNSVNNMNGNGTGNSTSFQLFGIRLANTGASNIINVRNNTIHTLLHTGDTSVAAQVHEPNGILFAGGNATQTVNITSNKIYNLQSNCTGTTDTGSTAPIVSAIKLASTTSALNVYNNSISLATQNGNTTRLIGISSFTTSTSVNCNVYYNSVYIGGTATGSSPNTLSWCFLRSSTGLNVLRNNIFYNFRSGGGRNLPISVVNATNWTDTTSNYNLFVANSANECGDFTSTLGLNFSTWKTNSLGDAGSLFETSTNLAASNLWANTSTADLTLNSAQQAVWYAVGQGTPVTYPSVSTDINSNSRSTTIAGGSTDIGSSEIGAPSSAPPTSTNTITADGTYDFTFGGKTIATLIFNPGTTGYPFDISLRHFGGVNPPGSGAQQYSNFYDSIYVSAGTPGTLNYDMRMYVYGNTQRNIGTQANTRISKSSNGGTEWLTQTSNGSYVAGPPPYALATGLTSFSLFTLSSTDSELPVELVSFTSTVNRDEVKLNWSTSMEINNSGFDIERKPLGATTWTKAGSVQGRGTTNEVTNYTFSDRGLEKGKYNYRLKQIDFNGNSQYFNLSNEVNVGVPMKFDLSQNYPNPFNPSTKINYDLPFDSKVQIKIFDITGREMYQLVNETKTAGYYTAQFNAVNLASGVYFYMINANGGNQSYVKTMKMVLVK